MVFRLRSVVYSNIGKLYLIFDLLESDFCSYLSKGKTKNAPLLVKVQLSHSDLGISTLLVS